MGNISSNNEEATINISNPKLFIPYLCNNEEKIIIKPIIKRTINESSNDDIAKRESSQEEIPINDDNIVVPSIVPSLIVSDEDAALLPEVRN